MRYELMVSFPVQEYPQLEEKLAALLGSQYDAGLFIPTGTRDCEWGFETRAQLFAAQARICRLLVEHPKAKSEGYEWRDGATIPVKEVQ